MSTTTSQAEYQQQQQYGLNNATNPLQPLQQQHQLLRSWRHDGDVGATSTVPIVNDVYNTPSAEATTMGSVTATATPHHHHHHRHHSIDMVQSPPLAQVVFDDTAAGVNDTRGSLANFPVANFVTNLVRSSIDQIHATTIQAMDRLGSAGTDTVPLYIRTVSDSDPNNQMMTGLLSNPSESTGNGQQQQQINAMQLNGQRQQAIQQQEVGYQNRIRTNTLSGGDPNLTEYVVVDGEIIAVPTQSPTQVAQYQIETLVRQQMMESNNLLSASGKCQPKKVKGGVRRIVKLFRKRSNGKKNMSAIEQGSTSTHQETCTVGPTEDEQPPQQQQTIQHHHQQQQPRQLVTPESSVIHGLSEREYYATQAATSARNSASSNVSNGIPSEVQQEQLYESQDHEHQQQQNPRSRRGRSFWKEKSKESVDSSSQQQQQYQQQQEQFGDTVSRKDIRHDRRQKRWGARRAAKDDRKKPPPNFNSQTTPPRSQDFSMNSMNSAAYNHPLGMSGNDIPNHRAPVRNMPLGRNELIPVDTGLMPPVSSTAELSSTAIFHNYTSAAASHDQFINSSDHILDQLVFDRPNIHQYEQYTAVTAAETTGMPHRALLSAEVRATSVTASFVGVEDITQGAHVIDQHGADGVLEQSVEAESFLEAVLSYDDFIDEYDYSRKKKDDCGDDADEGNQDYTETFILPRPTEKADKADSADAPDVEVMLLRAKMETITDFVSPLDADYDDEDAIHAPPIPLPAAMSATSSASTGLKSDGVSVALSEAAVNDTIVHNDILKVVMVSAPTVDKSWLARVLRNSRKRSRARTTLAVDVHEWKLPCPWKDKTVTPPKASFDGNESEAEFHRNDVKCMIWDVQGTTSKPNDGKANFAVHPATQSLFFSAQSLYVLVWDLACENQATYLRQPGKVRRDDDDSDDEDDDDDDEYDDEFGIEGANRQADRVLHADISSRVLSWVDYISEKGPMSGVLPVALIPDGMSQDEVKRRVDILQSVLEIKSSNRDWPKMLLSTETESIIRVHYRSGGGKNKEPIEGIDHLQDLIAAIAHDSSHQVFSHVGTPVPEGTVLVLDCIRRFKQEHKLILLDHLLYELGSLLDYEYIVNALHFLSSVGEIMYFGQTGDEVLSKFIILSHTWLVSALSCILRNDFKRELKESRLLMNVQSFYDGTRYEENEMIKALVSDSDSNIPLLSDDDAKMLWQSLNFMREASDRSSQFEESSNSIPNMFYFLERLLVDSGVFLPLPASLEYETSEKVFFVPSLLLEVNPTDIWTYKNNNSWTTTLCHSWLFRDGAPLHLMDILVVKLLRNIYDFSREFHPMPDPETMQHTRTDPLSHRGLNSFLGGHNSDQVGTIRIRQLLCWKSSFLIKIGSIFADAESGDLRETVVEMFVGVCGQSSGLCVASEDMRPGMQRVIVSGKGPVGHHGKKLWKSGYKLVLDCVRSTLSSYANVDQQIICPLCLEVSHPRDACTFMWNSVYAAATSGSAHVHCLRGHRVDSNLICGTRMDTRPTHVHGPDVAEKLVTDVLQSVVLVGLWDPHQQAIVNSGSGFIVNRKSGLIVTAGHTLITMDKGEQFGNVYFGVPNAKVVIGVISEDGHTAVFRYWAEIVTHDIHRVDACVLRIVSKMDNDIDDDVSSCAIQNTIPLNPDNIPEQNLKSLKVTKNFEMQEKIRILGFNQGGEGVEKKGARINRVADFAMGYVCRKFEAAKSYDSSSSSSSSESETELQAFAPRKEIVVICPTISGHSGGPCVNNEGKVIGILSRADPVENSRCYLVPATELKTLINQARAIVERHY